MKQLQKKGSLYHWVIVFACLLLSAASVGMLSYFNALFLSPVAQSLQVKRSALVLYSTCSTATTMLIIPFVGRLYRRLPMRPAPSTGFTRGACWRAWRPVSSALSPSRCCCPTGLRISAGL